MTDLTEYQVTQLTGLSECYIHTHPRVDNFTFVFGSFYDVTTQTASANTATAMKLGVTDMVNGTKINSLTSSKTHVSRSGIYNIQFSAQLANSDSSEHDVSIWLALNGAPVDNTTTLVTVPKKLGGINGHAVAAWNFFVYLNKGEYAELYWSTPHTGVFIEYSAPMTTPTRPAVPSVILTLAFVSDK